MSTQHDDLDRRRFLRLGLSAAALTIVARESIPAELPPVDPNDSAARSLGYVEDTTNADTRKFPQHQPTQMCGSCKLFTGEATAEQGLCALFAGKTVRGRGWCGAYQAKA